MAPQYRTFRTAPSWTMDGSGDPTNTGHWLEWMERDEVIHDFLPTHPGACSSCGTGLKGTYRRCYQCNETRAHIDSLVALSYSLDNGLESLVKAYKDFDYGWAAAPLASLLSEGFERHGECFEKALGRDAIYTWVPSDDESRKWDHLGKLTSLAENVSRLPWQEGVVVRNRRVERPRPGANRDLVVPEAYEVLLPVQGQNVLLFDDLWTSGASMGSAAAALKNAGAAKVVGLVLGRQLRRNNTYGNSAEVFDAVEKRGWTFDECTLCA